eukprot:116732-Rhodomonas_salina.1
MANRIAVISVGEGEGGREKSVSVSDVVANPTPSTDKWSAFLESEYHISTTEDHSKLDKLLEVTKLEHKSHNMKICPIYVFLRMRRFKFAFAGLSMLYFYLCCSTCFLIANRPTHEAMTFSFSALKMYSKGARLSMLNIAEISLIMDGCESATP